MVKLPSKRVSLHSHYFFQPTLLGNSSYFIYEKEKKIVYNYIYNFQKSTKEKINIFLCLNVMKGDDKINI